MEISLEAIFNMTSGSPQNGQYLTDGQKNISGIIGNKFRTLELEEVKMKPF